MTKMKSMAAAFAAGFLFAIGLGISGMTQPAKVIGFLDLSGGHWDPSLAFVMIGAIAVHLPLYHWLNRRRARSAAETKPAEAASRIDARLIGGAALFGVGWGLGGYCPGPAVVSAVAMAPGTLVFLAAMVIGMFIAAFLGERPEQTPPA